jgi:hypothetical protein
MGAFATHERSGHTDASPHQQNVNAVNPPIAIISKKTPVGNVYSDDWVLGIG